MGLPVFDEGEPIDRVVRDRLVVVVQPPLDVLADLGEILGCPLRVHDNPRQACGPGS